MEDFNVLPSPTWADLFAPQSFDQVCWRKIFHEEITPAFGFLPPGSGFMPQGSGFLPPGLGPCLQV